MGVVQSQCQPLGHWLCTTPQSPQRLKREKGPGKGQRGGMKKPMEKLKVNLKRKRLQNTSLSETELSVILGGLLGKGSLKIHPGCKDARYSFTGSTKEKEYFHIKCKYLLSLNQPLPPVLSPSGTRGGHCTQPQEMNSLFFKSKALAALTQVYSMTHKGGQLQIKRKWLNHCTAQSLAIWWFDHGFIFRRKGFISISKNTEQEWRILLQYLSVVWGVEARLHRVTKKRRGIETRERHSYFFYFPMNQLKNFLSIVLPYCPCAQMIYKCTLKYTDPHLQQRWISHMKKSLPGELCFSCRSTH